MGPIDQPRPLTFDYTQLLVVTLISAICAVTTPAHSRPVHGFVQGGGEANNLTIVGLKSRDLTLKKNILGTCAVDTKTGAFTLDVPDSATVYLAVTARCQNFDETNIAQCLLFFPRHGPIPSISENAGVLSVPNIERAQALWSGEMKTDGPLRPIGFTLLILLFSLGWWLLSVSRKSPSETIQNDIQFKSPSWAQLLFPSLTLVLLLPGLGTAPLDLLEYSYFHEGVRPSTFGHVISDFISAELAHGPIMPLILRAISTMSHEPWLLRLPSVICGALFVWFIGNIVRRELGEIPGFCASILAMCSPIAVYYSRDATPYALAGLVAAVTVWIILRAPSAKKPGLWWCLFAVLHIVGFFSHYAFAFVSVSELIAITIGWRQKNRRALGQAYMAFCVAGILPVLAASHLWHMIEASGIRFALMSPVYPESPGLLSFSATFLAILTGLPSTQLWGLIITIPVVCIGAITTLRHSRLLGIIVITQALFILLFLTFSHTMSTEVGGGRIFYAFRWTRPLLLGLLVPLAAITVTRIRWMAIPVVLVSIWHASLLIINPTHPAQDAVAQEIINNVQPQDAYAVLPAAFYGDPLQYHLAGGNPPNMITEMRPRALPLGDTTIFGPLMEYPTTLETAISSHDHKRLWVVVYKEAMFGVNKFDSAVSQRTISWIDQRYSRIHKKRFPYIDLYLYERNPPTAAQSLSVIKGRVEGYRGLWPFHVAVLANRDLSDPINPIAWATVDPKTGLFDIPVATSLDQFYLLGQLDLERTGQRLNGPHLMFLKPLPITTDSVRGKRLIFDLSDMELAHLMRDAGIKPAVWFALALALLLYGLGFVWYRRLATNYPPEHTKTIYVKKWPIVAIALGTTAPLLANWGAEALELLEFTYLHEGLRPKSIGSLLFDPISAELSHPPLWPLILRLLASISTDPGWLRLPSALCHFIYVIVVYAAVIKPIGHRTALVAAVFAGLAPISFYYGQDATPYALLSLVSATALYCALNEHWRSFAAIMVLGFFTHYTVGVLGICFGISLVWYWRYSKDSGRMRRALGGFALICVLPLFWSIHFIRTFLASGMSTRLMSVDYLPDPGFAQYVAHIGALVMGLPPTLRILTPLALALLVWGGVRAIKLHPLLGRLMAIQLVCVVAYILFVHGMYMRFAGGRVFYAYRWAAIFLPSVAICSAVGALELAKQRRWLGIGAGIILLVGSVWQNAQVLLQPQRPNQSAAIEKIVEEKSNEDAFLALPAVYYSQLFNYTLHRGNPPDLLAWPRWSDGLYGPFHARNTTVETLSQNLAFRRIWVAAFNEQMFGTPKFDLRTSKHQLDWMKRHLIPDGEWSYAHITLYRFKVPPAPERIWTKKTLEISFADGIKNFRYFPKLLHTQKTGLAMSQKDVALRIPAPAIVPAQINVAIQVHAGEPLSSNDLIIENTVTNFSSTSDGGEWTTTMKINAPLIELNLLRSDKLAKIHRNTYVRLNDQGTSEAPVE